MINIQVPDEQQSECEIIEDSSISEIDKKEPKNLKPVL